MQLSVVSIMGATENLRAPDMLDCLEKPDV